MSEERMAEQKTPLARVGAVVDALQRHAIGMGAEPFTRFAYEPGSLTPGYTVTLTFFLPATARGPVPKDVVLGGGPVTVDVEVPPEVAPASAGPIGELPLAQSDKEG